MKKAYLILMSFALLTLTVGCSEEALTPSDPQEFVDFPQGSNPYDAEFVAFYEDYGTYVLYNYTESDFRWNVTTLLPYYAVEPDMAAVSDVWSFFTEKCLTAWPDDFLRSCLPTKILLASDIYDMKTSWVWDSDTQTSTQQQVVDKHYDAVYGFNHLSIGVVNSGFATKSEADKLKAVGQFSCALMGYATSRGLMEIPQEFVDIYNEALKTGSNSEWPGQWGYNGRGHLEYNAAIDVYYDFGLFVKYMTTMTQEAYEAWAYDTSFDAGGQTDWTTYETTYYHYIQRKSKVVLEFFREQYGIDLHEMGNRAAGAVNQ